MRFSRAAASVIVTAAGFAAIWLVGPRASDGAGRAPSIDVLAAGALATDTVTSVDISRVGALAWVRLNCPHAPPIAHRDGVVVADRLYIDTARLDAVQQLEGQARACAVAVRIARTMIDAALSPPDRGDRILFGNLTGKRGLE